MRQRQEKPARIMSLDMFEHYTSTVPSAVDIHFSGFAEPWHAPECTMMVRHAHERGHMIAVFTTADGIEKADVEALMHIPFKRFAIHLPDQFGEMRLVVSERYIETLKCLINSNIHNLEFITLGVPQRELAELLGWQPSTRRIHSRAANIAISGRTVGVSFSDSEIADRNRGKSLVCRQNRMLSNVLLPNGDLHMCAMDYGLKHRLGNLNEQSYAEVLSGDEFREIFRALGEHHSEILCRRCEYAVPGLYSRVPL